MKCGHFALVGSIALLPIEKVLADAATSPALLEAASSRSAEQMYATLASQVSSAVSMEPCGAMNSSRSDEVEIVVCGERSDGKRYRIDRTIAGVPASDKTDVRQERRALIDPVPCDYSQIRVPASCQAGVPLLPIAQRAINALSGLLSGDR
jgi:hypothetical protein